MRTTRGRHSASGFTLIELIVVFLIVMLIIGIGALSLTNEGTKKQILGPANELKKFARRGLQMAVNNRRSFAIELAPRSFVLREGSVDTGSEDDADPRFAALFEEERANAGGVVDSFELDDELQLEVRRWGEKFFRKPEEHDRWVFEPSGICEPIGVKLIHPQGSVEMDFNPLTAKVSEQSLIIDARQ